MPLATGISTLATRLGVEFKSVRSALDLKRDKSIPTIPGSVNLDTYTATGSYHQGTTANAASGTNYPVPRAGLLEVETPDGGFFTYQRYTEYGSPTSNPVTAGAVYTRTKYGTTSTNGTWTPGGPRLSLLSDLSALSKQGLYAARPAATAVLTGTEYYGTDTCETYRAMGTDGMPATSWLAIPTGGTELGYAQITTGQTAGTGSTSNITITGLALSIVMPERPVEIVYQGLAQLVAATGNDITYSILADGVVIGEGHAGYSVTASDYKTVNFTARVASSTPGSTRLFTVAVVRRSTGESKLVAAPLYPASLTAIAR